MTRSDMPWERPKRCFSWPEEALLANDEDFIYLPRQYIKVKTENVENQRIARIEFDLQSQICAK